MVRTKSSTWWGGIGAFLTTAMIALLWSAPATAQDSAPFDARCASFRPTDVPNGAVVQSVTLEQPDRDRPLRCAIRGQIVSSPTSTINWKVDLPETSVWNGRLLHVGGGGFDGWLPTEKRNWENLAKMLGTDRPRMWTFVTVSSDSGHQGRGQLAVLDFSWALNNPSALKSHADMANHLTLGVATALTKAFYGKAPAYRYMYGQSNGGRQGIVAAQRHPEDYDGVLALAPAISQEGFAANHVALQKHMFSRPENWPSPTQITTFINAQIAACDALDGLKDGVIDNYEACRFDPAELICPEGHIDAGCLTKGQADSIRMVLSDRKVDVPLADGLIGYPAYGPGGDKNEWMTYLLGPSFEARASVDYGLTDNIVKYGITNDPNASLMTHDPTKWKAQYLALSEQIDATNPDLSAFAARNGKIITWYGVADYCVAMRRFAEYYRMVQQRMGEKATRNISRFYVSPSLGHGLDGAGANTVGLLSALQDWVEKSKAPAQQIASKLDNKGNVKFQRPLCEVGTHPKYNGKGDPNKATSFACVKN